MVRIGAEGIDDLPAVHSGAQTCTGTQCFKKEKETDLCEDAMG